MCSACTNIYFCKSTSDRFFSVDRGCLKILKGRSHVFKSWPPPQYRVYSLAPTGTDFRNIFFRKSVFIYWKYTQEIFIVVSMAPITYIPLKTGLMIFRLHFTLCD